MDRPLPNPPPQPSPANPTSIGSPGAPSAADVDRWMQEGLVAFQAQEYPAAVELWETLLQHDRSNYRILVFLSLAYNRMEAPELARGALMRAVKIEPRYAKAWNNLGNSFRDTGELFRAIDAYEKAVDLSPASADYRHNLAITYLDTLQYEPAIEQLRQYRALVPDDDTILALLASGYYQSGMPAKALSCVLKYLQRHPNTSQMARMSAQVKFLRGLVDGARPVRRAIAPPREPKLDDEVPERPVVDQLDRLDTGDFVISIADPTDVDGAAHSESASDDEIISQDLPELAEPEPAEPSSDDDLISI